MLLDYKTAEVFPEDIKVVGGDLNGHVIAKKDGGRGHGRLRVRNTYGGQIFDYVDSQNPITMDTKF